MRESGALLVQGSPNAARVTQLVKRSAVEFEHNTSQMQYLHRHSFCVCRGPIMCISRQGTLHSCVTLKRLCMAYLVSLAFHRLLRCLQDGSRWDARQSRVATGSLSMMCVQVCGVGFLHQLWRSGICCGRGHEQGRTVYIPVQLPIPLPPGRAASQHQLASLEHSGLQCNGCSTQLPHLTGKMAFILVAFILQKLLPCCTFARS